MKKALLALGIVALSCAHASAVTKYWDRNGTTAGSGNIGGTWDAVTSEWNTDPLGGAAGALSAWTTNTDTAAFSAGADGVGALTIAGSATAGGLIIQEGTVEFTGTITMGGSAMSVESGAILSTNSSLRIATTAGSVVTLNGGTLRTTNPAAAGSFVDTDTDIVLNGGGIFDQATVNILNIVQTATSITGTGPLTKTGVGVLAIASTAGTNTYSGGTIVNAGELRMRTVVNTLPVTTDVTVNSPGIFNLNGVSTQIGSLTGTGNVGTGSGTLTIDGATSTSFDGAVKNIANAGAGGVSSGNGRIIKKGASTITFNGLNDINGSVTLEAGGITVSSTGSLCGDIADVTVNGGTLDLKQAAETIENLAGSGGTIKLNNAALSLVSDPIASTSYAGTITGAGGLTRKNANATTRTLTLTGNNDYTGNTIVDKGIISVGHANALGTTAGYTQVTATGAEVLFTGAGGSVTTSEPFRIAGTGSTDNGAIAVIASATPTISGTVTLIGDATVTVSSTSGVTFNNANSFTSAANESLTLKGGSGAGAGGLISGIISLGTGALTKNEGGKWELRGANVYSGGTNVNAGTLLVNNTSGSATGSGPVAVASGATLGGSGSIAGTVTSSGTVSPGNSPGVLTIGGSLILAGGTYKYEIDSTPTATADLTNVTVNLSIATGAVALSTSDFGSSLLAMGTKFTLINYGGTWDGGIFTGLPNYSTGLVIGSNRFAIQYNDTTGGSNFGGGSVGGGSKFVTITAVPEASALLTMGLGFIFTITAVWVGKRFGVNALKV